MVKFERREVVGTTAKRIVNYDKSRTSLIIRNVSQTAKVYLGSDNTVTTQTGMELPPGAAFKLDSKAGGPASLEFYAIADSANAEVAIAEFRGPKGQVTSAGIFAGPEVSMTGLTGDSAVVSASIEVDAASNTSGVSLTLDMEHRTLLHWHVELGDAGEAKLQVSHDNSTWFDTTNSTSLSSAGSWNDWDFIGFRYVKMVVPTTGISVKIYLSAKP